MKSIMFVLGAFFVLSSCTAGRANIHTLINRKDSLSSLKSVAVLPMRNALILPNESKRLDMSVSSTFSKRNPDIELISSRHTEVLFDKSDKMNYEDHNRIKQIGKTLGVDALLQGEIDLKQSYDSSDGTHGKTVLMVRYFLISSHDGSIIWEVVSDAVRQPGPVRSGRLGFEKEISLLEKKILGALPDVRK